MRPPMRARARTLVRWIVVLAAPSLAATRAFAQDVRASQAGAPAPGSGTGSGTGSASEGLVAVAARGIARGAVLADSDIVVRLAAPQPNAGGAIMLLAPAVRAGWVARRVIRAGETLRAPAVMPPPVIRSGQKVQVVARQGGIELTVDGIATAPASLGDTVAVRLGAGRRVLGVVAAPARVVAIDLQRVS